MTVSNKYENSYFPLKLAKYRPVIETIKYDEKRIKTYAERVKEMRKAEHMSMEELGEICDITPANVFKIENSKTPPKRIEVDYLLHFCEVLSVSPEYLLGFTNAPQKFLDFDETMQPSDVIEHWNQYGCNGEKLSLCMAFDASSDVDGASFIIHQLWNEHFELLYRLYIIARLPMETVKKWNDLLNNTIVSKMPTPSAASIQLMKSEQLPLYQNISGLEEVYQRIHRSKTKLPTCSTRSRKIEPPNVTQAIHAGKVENLFQEAFVRLGNKSPSLLEKFIKIAASNAQEKEIMFWFTKAFEGTVFEALSNLTDVPQNTF